MRKAAAKDNCRRLFFVAAVLLQILLLIMTSTGFVRRGKEAGQIQLSPFVMLEETDPAPDAGEERWAAEAVTLPRGIYEARLRFTTNNRNLKGVYAEAVSGSPSHKYPVESSPETLYESEGAKTFRFLVKRTANVRLEAAVPEEVRVSGEIIRNDGVTFSIESAEISFLPYLSLGHELFFGLTVCLIIWVILFGALFYPARMKAMVREYALPAAGCALTLFAAMYPFLVKEGVYYGFDMQFQTQRIAYMAEGLSEGAFPVKIQPGWGGGYGDAVGVFYPGLMLYPSAILCLLGYSLQTAYVFYHFFVNTLTYVFGYAAFRRMTGNRHAAVVGSSLHCLFIYRLSNAYTHAALGELGGMVFLPLVLLGLWQIYSGAGAKDPDAKDPDAKDPDAKGPDVKGSDTKSAEKATSGKPWITLAIGLSGVVLSHVLTAYILALFIVLYCLTDLRRTLKMRVLLPLVKSVLLSAALCLYFLVPMVDYMLTQHLTGYQSSPERLLSTGAGKRQMFTWKYDVVSEENRPNGLTGGIPRTLGVVSLVILVLALLLIVTRRFGAQQKTAVRITLLTVLAMYLTMDNAFYRFMTKHSLGPVTRYFSALDYPWRFMIMAGILTAYLAVLCITALRTRRMRAAAGLVFLTITLLQALQYDRLFVRYAENFEAVDTEAFDGRRFYWEYSIEGSDPQRAFEETRIATYDAGVAARLSYRSGTTIYAAIINRSGGEAAADFPLWCYRGYRAEFVRRDGGSFTEEAFPGDNNRVRVMIPEDFIGSVRVFFHEPWYWRAAELFSLTALVMLLSGLYAGRAFRKTENQQNIPK